MKIGQKWSKIRNGGERGGEERDEGEE